MNQFTTNNGHVTWMGYSRTEYATVYFTHRITGHQCKQVCFDNDELQGVLRRHLTPGDFFNAYEPDVRYTPVAKRQLGIA